MSKYLVVQMNDGSEWGVPVELIARDRAKHYSHEFDGDVEKSLSEDTNPLFEDDAYEIQDWAVNNMNWSDFKGHQIRIKEASEPDFQEAWMSNSKYILTK